MEKSRKLCTYKECNNIIRKNKLCKTHSGLKCIYDNCTNVPITGNFCNRHSGKRKKCSNDECDKYAQNNGKCFSHKAKLNNCIIIGCLNKVRSNNKLLCLSCGNRCSIVYCNNNIYKDDVCLNHSNYIQKICIIKNCNNKAINKNLCTKHGCNRTKCSIENCNKNAVINKLCGPHNIPKNCSFNKCTKRAIVAGLCYEHNPDYKCINCNIMWTQVRGDTCSGPACKGLSRRIEYQMVDYILEYYEELNWIHNKTIDTDCNTYRPDLRLELDDRMLIIECDERYHQGIEISCEITRMFNIHQDFGIPTIFIRWNPDNTKDINIKLEDRLNELIEKINDYLQLDTEELVQSYPMIEYLYYPKSRVEELEIELLSIRLQLNL